jgi:hypothetical protein
VYTATSTDDADNPHAVYFIVRDTVRNYTFPSGRVAPYVLHGYPMHCKVVQTPLSRDVGYHTAPGPASTEQARANTSSKRIHVRTNKRVVPHEDFRIGGEAVRVDKLTTTGFYVYKLL